MNTANQKSITSDNEKVVSLFKFIKELNKLKQKAIVNIKDYIWHCKLSSIHNDPENIKINYMDRVEEELSGSDIDNVLLSVHKPTYSPCPKPDEAFADWLKDEWGNFHNNTVSLKQYKIINHTTADGKVQKTYEYFIENQNRVKKYDEWIKLRNKWISQELIKEKTKKLFSNLYKLYFELQRESETEEIIISNGFIHDKNDSLINHPVLTHRVNLEYDPDEDIVSIKDTSVATELYSTVFQSMQDINISSLEKIRQDLQNNDYHPLDRIDTPEFFKVLIHQLSSDSLYNSDVPEFYKERLLLYWEPCFIVRKRLDGTIKAIEQIIENVDENNVIPEPIINIVSGGTIKIPNETKEPSIEEQLAAVGGESLEILLSKQANKEQLEIAKRIEHYNAVLVQGPPGTGKTHTIANLLGHFLAQGKSILVTSHTTKALKVLKEKVATGLQDLCVSVLDDSNIDMEKSIDGITTYMSKHTSHELLKKMNSLEIERKDVIKQLALVRRKIFEIIKLECNCIVYNGNEISPSKAAEFIVEHADDLSYIPGKVRENTPLPLTFDLLSELYRSNEGLSIEDEIELSNNLPNPNEIIEPSEFASVWDSYQKSNNKIKSIQQEKSWTITNNEKDHTIFIAGDFGEILIPYPNNEAISELNDYCSSFNEIEPWMKSAAVDGKLGGAHKERWITLINQIKKTIEYKDSIVSEAFGKKIVFSNDNSKTELKNSFEAIKNIYIEKNKLSKLTLMIHKEYAEALEKVTIDGHKAQNEQDCNLILHNIELSEISDQCAVYWDELLSKHDVPKFKELDEIDPERVAENWISYIEKYLDWYTSEYSVLLDKLKNIGISSESIFNIKPLDTELNATDKILFSIKNIIPQICNICDAIIKNETYSTKINKSIDVLLSDKRGQSIICSSLYKAINTGNISKYAENYASLEKMYEKYKLKQNRSNLLNILRPVAPDWADAIEKRIGIHGNYTVPSDIEDAWKWKQLYLNIENITSKPFSELQKESTNLSKEYRDITAKYAKHCGWYHLLQRTETDINMKMALQGWRLTVKKIGKGTGKQAPALKAKARELMAKCQNAVPAWIMPINKALESLNPKKNRFDIIIIDEASQSDISSLAILYMGKKLIIVGDDKQVSPMAVGVPIDKINALEEMYIKGKIPNSHLYNGKTSIYDIASTTFQPLMLREHFRCVPEIIGFSNMLSYDNKIKPLRDASNSTLLPAVVNYRVQNGMRSYPNKFNTNEALAIVALLKSCIKQPEYKGKTIGVISLLGDEQAKKIQNYIENEISQREVKNRNILCGNSANFQGDERDIIFLSVVDSNNGNGPLHMQNYGSDDAYRKRYNVAASRAKDQLWVVHSLDTANDLKPGDIRKTLIDYASNPNSLAIKYDAIEKESESPFEAAVAKSLSDRGYHLVQQWKVGSYRLDIVAVCGKKTVAIECDGERWHSGENKIREDMERQTILERLGWRFIRIRGSEYYKDPESTINRVIKELSDYEIEPEATSNNANENRETDLLNKVKSNAFEFFKEYQEKYKDDIENHNNIIESALNDSLNLDVIGVENKISNLKSKVNSTTSNSSNQISFFDNVSDIKIENKFDAAIKSLSQDNALEHILSFIKEGTNVQHKTFGKGIITNVVKKNDQIKMTIKFSIEEKEFFFPYAFENGFLSLIEE